MVIYRKNKQKDKNLNFDGDKGGAVSPYIPKNKVLCISVINNKKYITISYLEALFKGI